MKVRVSYSFSQEYVCHSGVSQGGVLSPLLFLIYTVELPSLLKVSPYVTVQLFADDIKNYACYSEIFPINIHSSYPKF